MCERMGQKYDLESMPRLQPVAQLEIFHKPRRPGERFVERVFTENLSFQRKVARIKVLPAWNNTRKQIMIRKLSSAFIEPSHKWRHRLARFAPSRQPETRHIEFRILLMESEVTFHEIWRSENVISNDEAQGRFGHRNRKISSACRSSIFLAEVPETKRALAEILLHLRRC